MCTEQHKLLLSKKALRDLDIPPRKLLGRGFDVEEALLHKFLPYNGPDDDEDDPYAADHFRMYEFKVRRCTRSRSHDWTDCPFAHPGEKARRRDPRKYHYSGTVCPEFRRGSCSKGDNCEFAHGVFECWLHPARYRTEPCKDGKNCKRKVCFFAHTPRQLRLLPPSSPNSPPSPPPDQSPKFLTSNNHGCCVYCHHSISASPTSTLLSPSSPPLSPGYSPVSRFGKFGGLSYKEALTELMGSMEELGVSETQNQTRVLGNTNNNNRSNLSNLSWVDVNNFNYGDEPSQFVLSPSPNSGSGSSEFSRRGFALEDNYNESGNRGNESGLSYPDFGWVNDLLT